MAVAARNKPGAGIDVVFRALSDRTRLRILHLLRDGELCVCDLVRVIDAPQPKISRHLAYLRKAGLVDARKQGLWSYYTLTPAATDFHARLIDCLSHCPDHMPELARDTRKRDDCCGEGSGYCDT